MKGGVCGLYLVLLALPGLLYAQASSKNVNEEAMLRLQTAKQLYTAGEYERCRELLDTYIGEQKTGVFRYPNKVLARIYALRALTAYAFRGEGEGYKEEIRQILAQAVDRDPEIELGKPSEIPSPVMQIFTDTREEYLARFSRTRRRFNLGLLGALVIDPTVVKNPSLLQPGVFFSYNLSELFSLAADLRLPLSAPVWGSIRGQVGLSWYPSFQVRQISPSISTSYLFSLDNLSTYTHSISLSGQAEVISRAGLGAGLRAEFFRLDLILGLTDPADLPSYKATPLFSESFLRVAFANMSFFIFYTF